MRSDFEEDGFRSANAHKQDMRSIEVSDICYSVTKGGTRADLLTLSSPHLPLN
jgi:hypothetical protein